MTYNIDKIIKNHHKYDDNHDELIIIITRCYE